MSDSRTCPKCGVETREYYGFHGGFSKWCAKCNAAKNKRQRERRVMRAAGISPGLAFDTFLTARAAARRLAIEPKTTLSAKEASALFETVPQLRELARAALA